MEYKEKYDRILAAALDLDRTTLRSDGTLSERTRKALAEAAENMEVIVASGRPYAALPESILSIPKIRYAITSNGAAVFDILSGNCLFRRCVTPGSVAELLSMDFDADAVLEAFINGRGYADERYVADPVRYGATIRGRDYIRKTRHPVPDMRAFLADHCRELDSVDLVFRSEEKKSVWEKRIRESIPDFYLTSSVTGLLELSHKDGGKHAGAAWVLEQLNIPAKNLAAFGDAANDIDLLEYAGLGVAVSNAPDEVKKHADLITASNDEDGVALILEKIQSGRK